MTYDPNDVWICSTDGQMGQVCIINTIPELAVSSCNTVCNSRITCMKCVPPYRAKRSNGHLRRSKDRGQKEIEIAAESKIERSEAISNAINSNRKRQLIQQLSDPLSVNFEGESLLDYDSSDEDDLESQSGAEERDFQTCTPPTPASNIPQAIQNFSQDAKHSTMWIGNDDGR